MAVTAEQDIQLRFQDHRIHMVEAEAAQIGQVMMVLILVQADQVEEEMPVELQWVEVEL